jgi:hypothetical protein
VNKKDSIKDYLLAGNTETPPVKLSRLAHSRYVRIRCRVAENPAASRALLLALSGDLEADVRIAVANNPNAPLSLLAYLASDNCVDVRYAMAENYQLPPTLLRKLAADENPYVSARAQRTLRPNVFFRLISASVERQKQSHLNRANVLGPECRFAFSPSRNLGRLSSAVPVSLKSAGTS